MTERAAADKFVSEAVAAALASASIAWEVYPDMAPDGTVLADGEGYVIFGTSSGVDTETNGDVRIMSEFPYTVRAVAKGNVSIVDDVEAAIDSALQAIRQAPVAGYIVNSKRTGALSTLSPQQGRTYRYAGGRYLVTVRPTS